ncbi:MAG: hypothetical protein ACRC2S_10490 [Waterburya sp.]
MDTEQDVMYINLPGELYDLVSGVAVQRDLSIGRALEAIVAEWAGMIISQSISESKDDENKNDTDNPSNLIVRFDTLEVLIQNVAHKIDCLPCRASERDDDRTETLPCQED